MQGRGVLPRVSPGRAGSRAIRLVLADDSYLVREAIAAMLQSDPGIDVIAACVDREGLELTLERERPDVVVTDIRMPPTFNDEGIKVAAAMRESHPRTGVVILSQYA